LFLADHVNAGEGESSPPPKMAVTAPNSCINSLIILHVNMILSSLLAAFVSAAPVGDDVRVRAKAPTAPDLEALTRFCKDIGRPRPTFENGCYKVTGLRPDRIRIGCDKQGRLIKLDLRQERENWDRYRLKSVPESIGKLVNLKKLYSNLT
jgi:hypothetical protein